MAAAAAAAAPGDRFVEGLQNFGKGVLNVGRKGIDPVRYSRAGQASSFVMGAPVYRAAVGTAVHGPGFVGDAAQVPVDFAKENVAGYWGMFAKAPAKLLQGNVDVANYTLLHNFRDSISGVFTTVQEAARGPWTALEGVGKFASHVMGGFIGKTRDAIRSVNLKENVAFNSIGNGLKSLFYLPLNGLNMLNRGFNAFIDRPSVGRLGDTLFENVSWKGPWEFITSRPRLIWNALRATRQWIGNTLSMSLFAGAVDPISRIGAPTKKVVYDNPMTGLEHLTWIRPREAKDLFVEGFRRWWNSLPVAIDNFKTNVSTRWAGIKEKMNERRERMQAMLDPARRKKLEEEEEVAEKKKQEEAAAKAKAA